MCFLVILHVYEVLMLTVLVASVKFQVHITDGIQFVIGVANSNVDDGVIVNHGNEKAICSMDPTSSNGSCTVSDAGLKETNKIDILIIDVDSSDAR